MRRFLLWLALALSPVVMLAQARAYQPFPHDKHAKLFPTCEGCHGGIVSGDVSRSLPTVAQCEACHNGNDAKRVAWTPRTRSLGFLRFSHPKHASETDSAGRQCVTCHAAPGATWMQVTAAQPERCLTCHSHRATSHLAADNRCTTCHVPIASVRSVPVARVAAFPRPATHDTPDFVSRHAPAERNTSTCAICHARESCARCHVNAESFAPVTALARDERFVSIVAGKPAIYPVPKDHATEDFAIVHGAVASRDVQRCSTCHAQPSCESCHIGTGASRTIRALPTGKGGAAGVRLQLQKAGTVSGPAFAYAGHANVRQTSSGGGVLVDAASLSAPIAGGFVNDTLLPPVRRVRPHPDDFTRTHGTVARSGQTTCEGCHAQRYCSTCHAGESPARRFHRANFSASHAADAYSRELDCASCHNAEAFCRSCHITNGIGARGAQNSLNHSAEPQWQLQHGSAARQNLTNCTSCHQQRDCMRCHSTVGWGINPHGPGFNAERLSKQARPMCLRCHLTIPTVK
jgi:hypothetical protein